MPCLIVAIALVTPRLALALLWIFSTYIHRAYDSMLWPFLGFFVMPFTTLSYAAAINSNGSVSGLWLGVVLFAALVDLGVVGGSGNQARRRKRRRRD